MNNSSTSVNFTIIGKVSSPYNEKFAIPRQPGLVDAAKGQVTLINDANNIELVRGLEQFSHIWLLFIFHETEQHGWKPLVRPPRLGGNKKLGVLATRSTFRPNPIGMSVVKLDGIKAENKQLTLEISGLDLLDGTPIVDIKPYIPYSDAVIDAKAGFASDAPTSKLNVCFTESATQRLAEIDNQDIQLTALINQVLAQDPRPAYKQSSHDDKVYGMRLYHFNIKWRLINASTVEVFEIS